MNSQELSTLISLSTSKDYVKLSECFQKSSFNDYDIDIAFRKLLTNYKDENSDYNTLKIFIKFSNVNFQNPSYNNTTILMFAIDLGLFYPSEKIIKYFKYQEGETKLNINIFDNNSNSILFQIISSNLFTSEDKRIELFNELITENPDITHINKEGHCLLSLALLKGNYFISERLITMENNYRHIVSYNGDTLLHCAIRSGNILCVNLIKNILSDKGFLNEIENIKNFEGKTPIEMDKALGNFSLLIDNGKDLTDIELVNLLQEKKFVNVLSQLNEKIPKKDNKDLSMKWNQLLTEYFIEFNREDKTQSDINSIVSSFYAKLIQFFDERKNEITYDYPIIILNHIILKFKLGQFKDILRIFEDFQDNYIKKDEISTNYWMFYIISNFILAEGFIKLSQFTKAEGILENIEIFITNENMQDNHLIKLNMLKQHRYLKYLNSIEVLNQSNDIKRVLYLYKSYNLLSQGKIKDASDILVNMQSEVNYQNPIDITIEKLYSFLLIKLLYHNCNYESFYTKLKSFSLNGINESSNDNIFYLNSLGILNLHYGKYTYAEFCFKKCESIIKGEHQKEKKIQNIANFMPSVYYNLGLCAFYSKKYDKALKIFNCCKLLDQCKGNPCLYYRIGICKLEKELYNLQREYKKNNLNDNVKRIDYIKEETEKRKFILSIKNYDIQTNEQLIEAANNFKEAISLFNEKFTLKSSSLIPQVYLIKIFNSSYLNLLYVLSILENWTDILFIEKFKGNYYYQKENNVYVNNFIVQAYLNLGAYDKAIELLNEEINNKNDFIMGNTFFVYSNLNFQLYSIENFQIVLFCNFIKVNLYIGNLEHAKNAFIKIFEMLKEKRYEHNKKKQKDEDDLSIEIPQFIINLLIYYFLKKNRINDALIVLKKRTIPRKF